MAIQPIFDEPFLYRLTPEEIKTVEAR